MAKLHSRRVLIALAFGILMSTHAQGAGKPVSRPIEYFDVSLTQLVDVYKEAYTAAGFEFREILMNPLKVPGRTNEIELIFDFTNPAAPHKTKALRTFRIVSSTAGDERCAPCSLYGFRGFGDLQDHSAEEHGVLVQKWMAAHRAANLEVIRRLGKGFDLP